MADQERFRLELNYPLTLAKQCRGLFTLKTTSFKWSDGPPKSEPFRPQEKDGLTPGTLMQSDSYWFDRLDMAVESYNYACDSLRKWQDNHVGTEYLVNVAKVFENNISELIISHKGLIGKS